MDPAKRILLQAQDLYCEYVADSDAATPDTLLTNPLALENAWKVVATQKIVQAIDPTFKLNNDCRVVDVGCGRGRYLMILRALIGGELYGIDDFGDATHDYDQIRHTGMKFGITFARGDVTHPLPYEDESAHLVVSFNTLEHLHESPKQVMSEIYRVLKPGGICVLGLPNLTALYKRVRFVIGGTCMPKFDYWWESLPWRGHVREAAPGEVSQILKRSGFDAGSEIGFDAEMPYKMGRLPYFLYNTARRLSPSRLSDCIFCGGIK